MYSAVPFTSVLLEPVRSAEPPTISGKCAKIASSVAPDDARVASAGLAAATALVCAASASRAAFGMSPDSAAAKARRCGEDSSRASQAPRVAAPRAPIARQAERMSAGMSNGGWRQPSATRVAATSSGPSCGPCAALVPALVGAP